MRKGEGRGGCESGKREKKKVGVVVAGGREKREAGNQMEDVQKRVVAPKKIDSRGLLSSSSHCKEPLRAFEGEHASQYF